MIIFIEIANFNNKYGLIIIHSQNQTPVSQKRDIHFSRDLHFSVQICTKTTKQNLKKDVKKWIIRKEHYVKTISPGERALGLIKSFYFKAIALAKLINKVMVILLYAC